MYVSTNLLLLLLLLLYIVIIIYFWSFITCSIDMMETPITDKLLKWIFRGSSQILAQIQSPRSSRFRDRLRSDWKWRQGSHDSIFMQILQKTIVLC